MCRYAAPRERGRATVNAFARKIIAADFVPTACPNERKTTVAGGIERSTKCTLTCGNAQTPRSAERLA